MARAAVITGDIVNFTRLSVQEQKKLLHKLSAIAREYKLEFYRGDSFQLYCNDPSQSLKLILKYRTFARSVNPHDMAPMTDIRASIGIGAVKTPVRELRTATGAAFILSGRGFDSLNKSAQKLIIQSEDPEPNPAFRIIAYFTDYLMERLTARQAEVVFELLNNHTQTEIARELKKSQATVNQHVQSSGWKEMEKILKEFEQLTS